MTTEVFDTQKIGRGLIDTADKHITKLLASFRANAGEAYPLPNKVMHRVNKTFERMSGGSSDVFLLVVKHLDLKSLPPMDVETLCHALAVSLAMRNIGVEEVCNYKKVNGLRALDPDRHNAVIERATQMVREQGGDENLAREVYTELTQYYVDAQDAVLHPH